MCMVLYDDIFECGFSHIFTSKGKGIVVLNCASLLIFSTKSLSKMWITAVFKPPCPLNHRLDISSFHL